MGNYYHQAGKYHLSYKHLISALDILDNRKNTKQYGLILRMLGESNRATGNFNLALKYLDQSINIFDKLNDTIGKASAYNRKAAIYYETSVPDSVIYFVEQSLKIIGNSKNNSKLISNNYNIMGSLYNNIDRKLSMDYYQKSLKALENGEFSVDKANVLINIAKLYHTFGDKKSALESAKEAFRIATENNVLSYVVQSSRVLASVYEDEDDFVNAYKFMKIYAESRDTAFGSKRSQQIFNIQKHYDEEKRNNQIKYQNDVNYYKILILIIIIIIILLISAVLYLRQKEQIKKNKLLEEKNVLIDNQKSELLELNSNKDLLFSIMAHDLRNPLSTMQLIGSMLRDNYNEMSEEDRLEFIKDIITSSQSANILIENLLLWSRSQRNLISVSYEDVNIFEISELAIRILLPDIKKKSIKIINKIPPNLVIFTDSNMLITILRNFISNSIKFTNKEGIIIVDFDPKFKPGYLALSVIDTGVGMSQTEINNLFHPGKRLTNVGTENEKGTGLGLLICKDFCSKLNGYLLVESNLNEGSKFKVVLPIMNNSTNS